MRSYLCVALLGTMTHSVTRLEGKVRSSTASTAKAAMRPNWFPRMVAAPVTDRHAHILRLSVNSKVCALVDGSDDQLNDHRSIRLLRGSLDHARDRGRLRGEDSVACGHFGHLGARALIHPALKLRAHDMILGG